MEKGMTDTYKDIDELLTILEKIKEDGYGPISLPKAFELLAREVQQVINRVDEMLKLQNLHIAEWFDADENPPPNAIDVLVWDGEQKQVSCRFLCKGEWIYESRDSINRLRKVTHWMALPENPK